MGTTKEKKLPKGCYKISTSQLYWIKNAADTLSGMIGGGGDFDDDATQTVRGIDRFLKANGLERNFK